MIIQELMTKDPESCLATESCAVAGEIMRRRQCGFVPVVDREQRVVGVVTDRDLLLYLVRLNQPAGALTVEGCMTSPVVAVGSQADLEEAAQLMEQAAVHRLAVVDRERLVGVLSLKDIALAARRQWGSSGPHQVERQMAEIVEAIAAAR
jgi:CBS domain-containing protein